MHPSYTNLNAYERPEVGIVPAVADGVCILAGFTASRPAQGADDATPIVSIDDNGFSMASIETAFHRYGVLGQTDL